MLVIVGDDEQELFSLANFPGVLGVLRRYGDDDEDARSRPIPSSPGGKPSRRGYHMDAHHRFDAAPAFARELIDRLMDDGFDLGAAASVPNPDAQGFGHAYGFVVERLMAAHAHPDRAGDGELLLSAQSAEARALLRAR